MASDGIVDNLREFADHAVSIVEGDRVVARMGADEIERLRAALAESQALAAGRKVEIERREQDQLLAHGRATRAQTDLAAATAREAAMRGAVQESEDLMAKAYAVFANAFNRIHGLPRSADGELARDIGEIRAKIATWQRRWYARSSSTRAEALLRVVEAARAAEYEYFHPATGDGDLVRKMVALREALNECGTPTWPAGCSHPNSCARNRRCGYIGCAHQDRDIAQEIDGAGAAASPRAEG